MGKRGTQPGPRCQVHGCSKSGAFVAFLGLDDEGFVYTYGPASTESEDLHVCQDHAAMLGDPEVVVPEFGDQWRSVTILPTKAAGWRLVVEIRPSGSRSVLVLYPPGDVPSGDG